MTDLRPVLYVHGILLLLLSATMCIPLVFDLVAEDPEWEAFAQSIFVTTFVGGILYLTNKGGKKQMNIRQAFIFTTTAYVMLAAFCAQPFYYAQLNLSLVDSFFEAASGITSTGSTVISNLDALPPGILIWRSTLNALGGIGIVVLALAILPMLQVGGMQLFKTESSETMDKMLPRTTQIAAMIAIILSALMFCCALCYWLAGMSGFDAINHAMTTVSTGGFSTHDRSIGFFENPTIEWVSILFMISGATPLMLYYQVVHGRPLAVIRNTQFHWLVGIIALATFILCISRFADGGFEVHRIIRQTLFSVTAIVTTTGYSVTDYNAWGSFAIGVFFIIIVVGGCTGSTSGGVKIFRFQILYETAKLQLNRLMHPHGVFVPRYNNRPITEEISASVMSFIILFGASFSVLAVILSSYGLDFLTAMSAAAQALANVGPGLGNIIGPTGHYALLPDGAKWWLAGAMIVGRLELFTALVLLTPAFWRN